MTRFTLKRRSGHSGKFLASAALFLLILILFLQGLDSLSSDSARRQRESLERALARDITYCYSVEGSYPESLDYIRENYGLLYDEDRFFVDYQVRGANIYPDVTIIERGK